MSYETQATLEADDAFQQRNRAVTVQQAQFFGSQEGAAADSLALCAAVLRDDPGPWQTFVRLAAAGPGIADKVDTGDGGVDSSLVTDEELLSLTQANWPTVTSLYFASDGTPL